MNIELLKYHEFVTDKILTSKYKKQETKFNSMNTYKMQVLEFENKNLKDKHEKEWSVSGKYFCDLDKDGDWEEEKMTYLNLIHEDENRIIAVQNYHELHGQFPPQSVSDFMDKLREELYNDLLRGDV